MNLSIHRNDIFATLALGTGLLLGFGFVLLWAELAVGIFTVLGS